MIERGIPVRTDQGITSLQRVINEGRRIVFFGGAGVSTESGIPDFRSDDGLYNQQYKYPPEEMVSHSFYISHTEEFFRFYREKMIFPDAKPNKAHLKLAELERAGKLSCVITQNIDGLHQAAGSRNVVELHGSIHRNFCEKCGKFHPLSAVTQSDGVPFCGCGGRIKPDVVLYEEQLKDEDITRAVSEISQADVLIIGGTSLSVYPAAGLIRYFGGRRLVVINQTPTKADMGADLVLISDIGRTLGAVKV